MLRLNRSDKSIASEFFTDDKKNFQLNDDEIAQGIVAPQDSLNAAGQNILGGKFLVGSGIFVLTDSEMNALKLSRTERDLVKPYFTTLELGRYFGSSANQHWIIYTDSRFNKRAEMRPYPTLKLHLDQYQDVITSHNAPYGLHRARDESFFLGEKIIAVRKCSEPTFTFTDFPCYVSQTFNVIKTSRINLRYLTGFLNSSVVRFWLRNRGKMQGNNFQLDKEPLLAIPYLSPPGAEQARIARLVDQIIQCKRQLSLSRSASQNEQLTRLCAEYENLVDEAVENLYGISADDKAALAEV